MNETLKKAVLNNPSHGCSFTFYWADWSKNVCIVKRAEMSYSTFKIKRTLDAARNLWDQLVYECGEGGPTEIVTYEEGIQDSEIMKWVRMRLAE